MTGVLTAADLGVPRQFNAASFFVDRHLDEGRGGAVAIECGDQRVTYSALAQHVSRCASAFRDQLRVHPEERVLLLLLDGPAFAYAFFGALKIGAVAVPVNTLLKPHDYQHLLDDSRASVLVVSHALLPSLAGVPLDRLRRLRHVVVTGGPPPAGALCFEELLASAAPHFAAEPTSRDDAAFWLYSSGSTGASKGCIHLHHDMVVSAEMFARRVLGITDRDRCFSVAKLFFAYGLGNALYFPLLVGATSILWPGPPAAAHVYDIIERHRPTLFSSVPTNYGMLLAHQRSGGGEFDLSSLRHAVSAGEALPPALFERFKQRFGLEIIDAIGSTEALHMFITNRPGAVRPGSSGQVLPGFAARLLDDERRPVAIGEVGHLWVAGDSICAGYWNQHEKTKETFEGPWLRTGDKYTVDGEGYYWYVGRSDDLLKVGGQWVSPFEVESALLRHPEVQECGVVGREDHDALLKPMAFVVLKPGVDATTTRAEALQAFVRAELAEYKRPRWVAFVSELPKTATGKIQRFKLREQVANGGRALG